MVAELTVAGPASSARIQIGNESDQPLPYETHVTLVDFDENGVAHETPADQDFLVFPPQGAVPPKSSQVIRVQWIGDPQLKTSRSYYLEVRQLPVSLTAPAQTATGQATAVIQVTYRIKALLTVAPKDAHPAIYVRQVVAAMIEPHRTLQPSNIAVAPPEPPKVPGLQVTLENDGARHALMGGVTWIVEGDGPDGKPFRVTIPRAVLSGAIGVGYVPPAGGKRVFNVPFDTPSQGPLTLHFTE